MLITLLSPDSDILLYCYMNENSRMSEVQGETLRLIQDAIKSWVAVMDEKCSFVATGFTYSYTVSQHHEIYYEVL